MLYRVTPVAAMVSNLVSQLPSRAPSSSVMSVLSSQSEIVIPPVVASEVSLVPRTMNRACPNMMMTRSITKRKARMSARMLLSMSTNLHHERSGEVKR